MTSKLWETMMSGTVTAMIFWLKCRGGGAWRDQEPAGPGVQVNVGVGVPMTELEREERQRKLLTADGA